MRRVAGSMMLLALLLSAADCKKEENPSDSPSPNCSWTNLGDRVCEYPVQRGVQPAPSLTP